jgi:hypothetical protein
LDAAPKIAAYYLLFGKLCSPQGSKLFIWRLQKMVKFQVRWINKSYKRKPLYQYKFYYLGFPTSLNEEIELQLTKDFKMEYTKKEIAEQEIINITLTRNKKIKLALTR